MIPPTVKIIDQRVVQRRGGACVRFPVSCLIRDLLVGAGLETGSLVVLDVTYGEGRFYGAWRPRLLLGSDIVIRQWVVEPDWFTRCPSWATWQRVRGLGVAPDLVVVDPPWSAYVHRLRRYFGLSYGLGSPETVIEGAYITAVKTRAQYMLIHYRDRIIPHGTRLVDEVFFKPLVRNFNKNIHEKPTWFGLLQVDKNA